jgi:ABC-type multidrug transport system fused ATPase/permease subunit
MVKRAGRNTLKEVERATIEKLSNKIFRQFTFDMFLMIVPILVVALEWRQATIVSEDRNLLVWLMVYFGTMFLFSFLRLSRVPILQYTKGYFIYVMLTATVYYISLFAIFIWGNIMFWGQLTDNSRLDYDWQKESLYDHRILWIIMSVILTLNWVAILLCLHFIFFFSTLYVFWNSISKMVIKIAQDLSHRALMESIVEVLGEGEI